MFKSIRRWRSSREGLIVYFAFAVWIAGAGRAAAALPDSPEVKQLVDNAVAYLETSKETGIGSQCMVGRTLLKVGKDETDPKIQQAATSCVNLCRNNKQDGALGVDVYSNGIIFLCELDSSKYQAEIFQLLNVLQAQQKPHGGWGYSGKPTGDTSMTQYAVLANWVAAKHGFNVPLDSIERVTHWLMRTQDPGGGWSYQGLDAGGSQRTGEIMLVRQKDVYPGPSAAALGSLYICADMLRLTGLVVDEEDDPNLPPALKPIRSAPQIVQKPLTEKIDPQLVRAAMERGIRWWLANYKIESSNYPYYYLYALERGQSFAELASGITVKESRWYKDGYQFLKRTQLANGSWDGNEKIISTDTCFGILFLVRATQTSIEKSRGYSASVLAGGQGLPVDLSHARVKAGRILSQPATAPVTTLLDLLTHPDDPRFKDLANDPQDLVRQIQEEEGAAHTDHLARIRQLASRGPMESRLAAVRVLSQLRDMDSVPTLIHAMSEEDWQIVYAANDGLLFVSRRVGAEKITEVPDEKARTAAISDWKAWYATVRPAAVSAR